MSWCGTFCQNFEKLFKLLRFYTAIKKQKNWGKVGAEKWVGAGPFSKFWKIIFESLINSKNLILCHNRLIKFFYHNPNVQLRRISHMLQYCMRMDVQFSMCMCCVCWLYQLRERWLSTRPPSNPSSNSACILVKKSLRADVLVFFNCWSKCSL